MIITGAGRATAQRQGIHTCILSLSLFLFFELLPCAVLCLMCVSWKINTAKLRKINKCQRSTRSLSHLTIITLIWDMLTNLLCPHLREREKLQRLKIRRSENVDADAEDAAPIDRQQVSPAGEKTSNLYLSLSLSVCWCWFCCRLGRCHQRRCRCAAACCVKLSN